MIQRLWDHSVEESATTLVRPGSAIGMMDDLTLDGCAPLYGRILLQDVYTRDNPRCEWVQA
ncbi:AAA+ superfamily ATPase fused to HTH and RecB nuclease domains [Halalkaliarchaeum sp. AArc-CO]|nr:AAA+ superfamily ATPase fused to HTH and RecB nuclease domains [Halalkaliarchaeum sp. AArc-CO]